MRILQLLKMRAGMTVGQLTDALPISQMGIRQHLAILESESLVEYYREKQKRGRPLHVYRLTDQANSLFPTTYANFAVGLMHEVAKFNGPRFHQQSVSRTHEIAVASLSTATSREKICPNASKNSRGYEMKKDTWHCAMNEDDYVLIEHNCPISVIAEEYPYVCEIELGLFRQSLGTKVVREEHLMRGSHRCCYRIAKAKEK